MKQVQSEGRGLRVENHYFCKRMTKNDYIKHWKTIAARDWKAVQDLFKSKNYIHALFFAHLVLEKLCKAHWIKDNTGNNPPRIHNLVRIIEQTRLEFSEKEMDFFRKMNDFQIEGRYSDYKDELYRVYKLSSTKEILKQVNELRKCLLNKLQ